MIYGLTVDIMFNKIIVWMTGIFFILFFFSSYAQEARISIKLMGFGETTKDVYFIIENTGEIPLRNIMIAVDGKEYPADDSKISPGMKFRKYLYLDYGEHLIEVKTLEGANDSINVTIPFIKQKPIAQEENKEKLPLFDRVKIWLVLTLILILIVVIWLLLKKPKLE
jgi:hypothetical protein